MLLVALDRKEEIKIIRNFLNHDVVPRQTSDWRRGIQGRRGPTARAGREEIQYGEGAQLGSQLIVICGKVFKT